MEIGQFHAPGRFTPRRKDPETHWIGGLVGPKACLDAAAKSKIPCPSRESKLGRPAYSLVTILTELSRLFPYSECSNSGVIWHIWNPYIERTWTSEKWRKTGLDKVT
jgi:hypothetical protein